MSDDTGGKLSSVQQDAWGDVWDLVRTEFAKAAPKAIATLPASDVKLFIAAMTDAMTSHAWALAMDERIAYDKARNLKYQD